MVSGCLAKVAFSDAKHNFFGYYLAALAVLLVTPIIFGLAELDRRMSAMPLETMSLLMGIILLTPVLSPEQNENILETVCSKRMSRQLVTSMRILCSATVLAVLVAVMCVFMHHGNCDVTLKMCTGAFAGAFAAGSLGFFCSAVSDNAITGYMVSVMYFMMNLFMKNRLGIFSLMSMSCNIRDNKLFLLITGFVLIIAAMVYRRLFRNES